MLPVRVALWVYGIKKTKMIRSVQNQTTPTCTGATMTDEDNKLKQIKKKLNVLSKVAVYMNHDAKKY